MMQDTDIIEQVDIVVVASVFAAARRQVVGFAKDQEGYSE
jgi:hypothetical protein